MVKILIVPLIKDFLLLFSAISSSKILPNWLKSLFNFISNSVSFIPQIFSFFSQFSYVIDNFVYYLFLPCPWIVLSLTFLLFLFLLFPVPFSTFLILPFSLHYLVFLANILWRCFKLLLFVKI